MSENGPYVVTIDSFVREPGYAGEFHMVCSECGSLGDTSHPQDAVNVRRAHLDYHERQHATPAKPGSVTP